MTRFAQGIGLAATLAGLWAADRATLTARAPVPPVYRVQDRNFYVRSMIELTPARRAAETDSVLLMLAASRHHALEKTLVSCTAQLNCHTSALLLNNSQTAAAGEALRRLWRIGGGLSDPGCRMAAAELYVASEGVRLTGCCRRTLGQARA